MGIRFGPFDPLQLLFEVINALMKKGVLNIDEAREIIKKSLPPEMSEEEKQKILDSLIIKKP